MRMREALKHAVGMESIWGSEGSVHTPSWLVSLSSLVLATSRPAQIYRSYSARRPQEQSKCVTFEQRRAPREGQGLLQGLNNPLRYETEQKGGTTARHAAVESMNCA